MSNSFVSRVGYVDGILKLAEINYVFSKLFNTNYSGEVAYNKSVTIESLGEFEMDTYDGVSDLNYTDIATDGLSLVINQQKAIGKFIGSAEKIQNNPNLQADVMKKVASAMKRALDSYLASVATGVSTSNKLNVSSPVSLATDNVAYTQVANVIQCIRDAGAVGDINVVVPPVVSKHLGIDSRFLNANTGISNTGVTPLIKIMGANVYESPFDTKSYTEVDAKAGIVKTAATATATTIATDGGNTLETGWAKNVDTGEIMYITNVTAGTAYDAGPPEVAEVAGSITVERGKNGTFAKAITVDDTIKNVTVSYLILGSVPESFGTYALALESIRIGQSEKKVGDYIQALMVFGAKVLFPNLGAISYVKD